MIELEYIWVLCLLPLPLLLGFFLPAYGSQRASIKVPFFQTLATLSGAALNHGQVVLRRSRWQVWALWLSWLLLVMAAAKPVYIADAVEIRTPARDLMIAVDLSGSMAEQDFATGQAQPLTRLAGAKQVLSDFAQQREGDRLGLMVFADAPFLQLPFSQDKVLFRQLLQQSQVRMAGAKTMLGDAIGFAYNHFIQAAELDADTDTDTDTDSTGQARAVRNRVLLLLTDGNDSGSKIPPVEAAALAAKNNIKIYPIVLGDPDASGEKAIDEQALQQLAKITGGQFFRASDAEALTRISNTLNQLEPAKFSIQYYYPSAELYYYLLLLAFLLLQSLSWGSLWQRHAERRQEVGNG